MVCMLVWVFKKNLAKERSEIDSNCEREKNINRQRDCATVPFLFSTVTVIVSCHESSNSKIERGGSREREMRNHYVFREIVCDMLSFDYVLVFGTLRIAVSAHRTYHMYAVVMKDMLVGMLYLDSMGAWLKRISIRMKLWRESVVVRRSSFVVHPPTLHRWMDRNISMRQWPRPEQLCKNT